MKVTVNKILTTIAMTMTTIGLTACGGGTNEVEGFTGNSYEEINISKSCTSPDVVDEYISLESGDQIVKDSEGTEISILHDENSVKKICLNSGTAHIERAYTE